VLLVRGGPDTIETLREDTQATAQIWSLDRRPLFGISVAAAIDVSLRELLRTRRTLSQFPVIHTPTVAELRDFQLLPTFRHPHFTVRLQSGDDLELAQLLAALGPPQVNPEYRRSTLEDG
jgi:hypothetical protein